jgi:hypothetical protein
MTMILNYPRKLLSDLARIVKAVKDLRGKPDGFVGTGSTGYAVLTQLGTGTPSAANVLRGDGTWAAVAGGSTPTGTGFTHITAGVQDAAAALMPYSPHVISSNFTLTAGYTADIFRYIEVSAGVTLEVGADSDLEVA